MIGSSNDVGKKCWVTNNQSTLLGREGTIVKWNNWDKTYKIDFGGGLSREFKRVSISFTKPPFAGKDETEAKVYHVLGENTPPMSYLEAETLAKKLTLEKGTSFTILKTVAVTKPPVTVVEVSML